MTSQGGHEIKSNGSLVPWPLRETKEAMEKGSKIERCVRDRKVVRTGPHLTATEEKERQTDRQTIARFPSIPCKNSAHPTATIIQ